MRASTIKRRLRLFDAKARKAARALNPLPAIQKAWRSVMKQPLSSESAKIFVRHYKTRKAAKKARKQRGGDQMGAPLDYVMGPGASAFSTTPYGQFTTDISTDPQSLATIGSNVEIPEIAQLKDCGVDRFPNNPTLAQSSGMAQSGGKRRNRKSSRRVAKRNRKNTRKQRGGNLFANLQASMTEMSRSHGFDPQPGAPHAWVNQSHGISGYIDPALVSQLGPSTGLVANQAWGPFASSSS